MLQHRKIAVIGLGYVGLTLATAFGKSSKIIGFDKNIDRITNLKAGYDLNGEISTIELKKSEIRYTTDPEDLKEADFYIVSVPTPLNASKNPDMSMLLDATALVGKYLKKGDIVVYESTVYPGATEDECIPVLEAISKLQCSIDFGVGYSPERINPGDKEHTFENITKVISGINEGTLKIISDVYNTVVKAGVYPVSSIKVAEATKLVENIQREVNISLMNEIVLILNKLNMNISEVLAAACTKWNFQSVKPGLVGGHCIGVNSYYLAHKAKNLGIHPDVILAGQRANDNIIKFIVDEVIKKIIHLEIPVNKARVGILGITYKENYSDFRDSKVVSLVKSLQSYGVEVLIHDPLANVESANDYGIKLNAWETLSDLDAIIITVPHQYYLELDRTQYQEKLKGNGLIMDLKGALNHQVYKNSGIDMWKL